MSLSTKPSLLAACTTALTSYLYDHNLNMFQKLSPVEFEKFLNEDLLLLLKDLGNYDNSRTRKDSQDFTDGYS